ncbi:MAG: XdhC family protein [Burkholderiaceae bacterium]|jgi:xanthine dehydrogenase accessory factor|nr:XdhC family protein [Burkholderiaceae bacterium]
MENLDLIVLRALCDWRVAGRRAMLANVVRTWGSSPRPVGSIMALSEDGAVAGSVSGGCIEDDLVARYTNPHGRAARMPTGAPQLTKYGVTADAAHRFGLPCGGTLELLLEFDPEATALQTLVTALEAGRLMRRTVRLADGRVELAAADAPAALALDAEKLVSTFGPEYRMLLIGAGPLAQYLATMARFCGFAVTLCDPRIEYQNSVCLPGLQRSTEMPDDAVQSFAPDRRSCVIALAHDPKLDDLALLEAIDSPAFYVGAIGSRRSAQTRRERMIKHFGKTASGLARLHGPVGLYIGSQTPPEIAVSIMADVLAAKNGVQLEHEMKVEQAKDLGRS